MRYLYMLALCFVHHGASAQTAVQKPAPAAPASTPITLDQAFAAAATRLEVVQQSRERVNQAEEKVNQARGGILPAVALGGTFIVQPRPRDPIAREFFPERQNTVNLSLTQPLFRGFREFAGLRSQKDLLEAAKRQREFALLGVYQTVATAVLTVETLEQDLRNVQAQNDLYGRRVNELSSRARTGQSNRSEVLTAQSTQASLQAEIQLVRGQLQVARENFASLTGLPTETVFADNATSIETTKLSPVADYLKRIDDRPDVRAALEQVRAADEAVALARGAHWPSLDAVGNYYFVRPPGFTEDIKWDAQLRLTLPLFEGGVTQSKVREAMSVKTQAELEVGRLRREADRDIRSLHVTLGTRMEQIRALAKANEIGERNTQVLQTDFRRGLTRNLEVQLALTELRVARRAFDQARYGARSELLRLGLASGERPPALIDAIEQR